MSRRTSDEILAEHAADVAHTVGINMTKVTRQQPQRFRTPV